LNHQDTKTTKVAPRKTRSNLGETWCPWSLGGEAATQNPIKKSRFLAALGMTMQIAVVGGVTVLRRYVTKR
jgi:hypothetical protein